MAICRRDAVCLVWFVCLEGGLDMEFLAGPLRLKSRLPIPYTARRLVIILSITPRIRNPTRCRVFFIVSCITSIRLEDVRAVCLGMPTLRSCVIYGLWAIWAPSGGPRISNVLRLVEELRILAEDRTHVAPLTLGIFDNRRVRANITRPSANKQQNAQIHIRTFR